jgi:predicted Zn finger-like uncharacterized protein
VVVSCQKCRTRFQLDEGRIPAKGVRVRCSKCKHAFFVAPPGSHDDTIHGLAEQAAVQGRPAKPRLDTSVDLPPVRSGEPEDDWQFNIDPPGAAGAGAGRTSHARQSSDDDTPPPAEITDSEPTESDAVDSFFELDGLSDPGPEREQEPAGAAAAPADPASAPRPAEARKAAPPPIEPEQEVTFEDLGSPETWDFGVAETPRPAAPKPAAKTKTKAKAKTKHAEPARVESAPAPAQQQRSAPRLRADSLLGSLAGAAGWLLAIALFGLGLHGALTPLRPGREGLPPVRIGSLELADVRVRHVENLLVGPVVVVTGELRNPGDAGVQGVAPRLQITDARGRSLDIAPVWLGVVLSPAELREADPGALRAAQARSARVLAERSFEPQDRVSVTAVLAELPPEASAFRIEAGALEDLPAAPELLPSAPAPAATDPAEAWDQGDLTAP